jgi:hypothetical protein
MGLEIEEKKGRPRMTRMAADKREQRRVNGNIIRASPRHPPLTTSCTMGQRMLPDEQMIHKELSEQIIVFLSYPR